MDLQIYLNLSEYQASKNKAHLHSASFAGTALSGSVGSIRGGDLYHAGIMSSSIDGHYSYQGWSTSGASTIKSIYTNFTPSGSITINSDGTVSKPPTVAFMWILRFA